MQPVSRPIGGHLREWRQRRRLSQLALACDANMSTRQLSFIETGRSLPSRGMVLRLAERLEVPLRERNLLLVAAGYAPVYPERSLQDPALEAARKVIDLVLAGYEPYPALAIDRHWKSLRQTRCSRLSSQAWSPLYCARPSMRCVSGSTRQGSHRASPISPNCGRICWRACAGRSMSPATRHWRAY